MPLTITVTDPYTGKDRQITRADFVQRWESELGQLIYLSMKHHGEFDQWRARVREIATERFDELLELEVRA